MQPDLSVNVTPSASNQMHSDLIQNDLRFAVV